MLPRVMRQLKHRKPASERGRGNSGRQQTLDGITSTMLASDDTCAKAIQRALQIRQCVSRVATVYQSRVSHVVLALQFQEECLTSADAPNTPKLVPALDHPSFVTDVKRSFGLIDMQYKTAPTFAQLDP